MLTSVRNVAARSELLSSVLSSDSWVNAQPPGRLTSARRRRRRRSLPATSCDKGLEKPVLVNVCSVLHSLVDQPTQPTIFRDIASCGYSQCEACWLWPSDPVRPHPYVVGAEDLMRVPRDASERLC